MKKAAEPIGAELPEEVRAHIEADPKATGMYAYFELEHGRLGLLAEHIRRCDFNIDPKVAEKLLTLIEGAHEYYELAIIRRPDLPSALKNERAERLVDFEMAIKVARLMGGIRGREKAAREVVGEEYGLKEDRVRKRIAPYRSQAHEVVEEEKRTELYASRRIDFLGRPNRPTTSFDQPEESE